ncbi:MAG TPA: FAD-dependent oxidoreductase [Ruminiclostridium sp.]|nr:FAD-dependent oxidoreductase [Ruminiclostridium sp.]
MTQKKNPSNKLNKRIDILIRITLVLIIVLVVFFFAVKPMLVNKDFYFESSGDVKLSNLGQDTGSDSYDVAVIGDGIDGISAALGAAKVGAKTLLVCSDREIGSGFKKSFDTSWMPDVTPTGNTVSSDIFREIRYKSGEGVNIDNYVKTVNDLVTGEKGIRVMYNSHISGISVENGEVRSIELGTSEGKKTILAKQFIDATNDGEILKRGNVGFSTGYSDIGIKGLYPPASLKFMVSGVDYKQIKDLMSKQGMILQSLLKQYNTSDSNITLSGLNISDQGNGKVLVEGITVNNLDYTNEKLIRKYYNIASKECMDLYNFLKLNLEQFKNASGASVASQFSMPSAYHFKGSYTLSLGDVLTGKRFSDRISTASRPVTMTLKEGTGYILCNPKIFYIPLRSMVPQGMTNVLMTGDKISCSSLVQSAIESNSSKAGSGYAAGIISAYSISKKIPIPQIVEDHNLDTQTEIEKVLRKQGIFMSDVKEDLTSITQNWSYPYAEKLINIGLLSAGITNDLKFNKQAKSEDFAYVILNGVARVAPSKYNYNFDVGIRKYLKGEPLTKDKLAQILSDLFGKKISGKNYYEEACKQGLIDQTLQQKLKGKAVLEYSDMYYAAVSAIEKVAGKSMNN